MTDNGNSSNEALLENAAINKIIENIFRVESFTYGDRQQGFLRRYIGRLTIDSETAFTRITEELKPLNLTALFREEDDKHVILLIASPPKPGPSNPQINLIMFVLTFLSMLTTGLLFGAAPDLEQGLGEIIFAGLVAGIPFTAGMLPILLAHEFGHYLAARYHNTDVTLPYFIPFPLSLLGTLGAFIRLKEFPRDKNVLHDIGVAGPLAGLVVAIVVLFIGLFLSTLEPIPETIPPGSGLLLEGNSLLYLFAKFAVFRELLPQPADYGDTSVIAYWFNYFFTGRPIPLGGLDVIIHPVARAGWAGLLVTALNLLPVGQLDGGHLVYVLFGKQATRAWPIVLGIVILLGFTWSGWWIWALLIYFMGRTYAEPLDQITPLSPGRRAIAWLGVIIFFLVFTPVPFIQVVG
ncbi:MAG: site-2 protease family protein [Chloroflexi bacterium]|nr:MAG: site-2 protease family protein [Chloroflexota bacterium]MBL1197054.1 site-2 protease family protein [Chloroflexota bacterium]NOH14349.1 site-2 protease family protein [Chloroflexota bacterium]